MKRKCAGWGHWRTLTPEQRELRGAKLREGRQRAHRLRLERSTDDAVVEALNEISVQSHVRMQVAKTTRVSAARRKKRSWGVKKVVL